MLAGAIATAGNCHLPDFAEDFTLLAGTVKGIAVAQQARDGVLNKDDLAGELFLGRNLKMSSLDGLDGAGFVKDLEDIGKEATNLCGSGGECEVVDVKSISDGFGALEKIQNSLTDEQKNLLKQTDTFKDLVDLQDALSSFIESQKDTREIFAALNATDVSDPLKMALFLYEKRDKFRKVLAAKTKYETVNQLIGTLESAKRAEYIRKIDALLQLESVQKTITTEAASIQNMKTAVLSLVQKVKTLSEALSSRTDRIGATMDKMVPILASSVRSPPHPLLSVFSDLDTTIRNFETKFLNGSNFEETNAIQLKTQLEPIRNLITVMKPLHVAWSSKNIPDDIEIIMNDIRLSLDAAVAELSSLSSFSQIHQCIKDYSPESPFSFDKLKGTRSDIKAIKDNDVEKIKLAPNPFDGLVNFELLAEISRMEWGQLSAESGQVNYTADVLVELEKFENETNDLVSKEIQTFLNEKELSSVFADLKLGSVSDVVDCLRHDDLIEKLRAPVSMTSISALKSDSFEMKTAVAAVNSLRAVSEEWNKIKSTPMSPGKRRRDVEGSVHVLNNAVDIANKLLDAAVVIRNLAKSYTARNELKVLLEPHALENETETLKKMQMEAEFAKVWNEDTKTMLREFPANVEKLDQLLDSCLISMSNIGVILKHVHVFNFPHIDFHELARIARRAHKGTAITDFTRLDMRFANAKTVIGGLTDGDTLQSLESFLKNFLDPDLILRAVVTTIAAAAVSAGSGPTTTMIVVYAAGSLLTAGAGAGGVYLLIKHMRKRKTVEADIEKHPVGRGKRKIHAADGWPPADAVRPLFKTSDEMNKILRDFKRREEAERDKPSERMVTATAILLDSEFAPKELTEKMAEKAEPAGVLPPEIQQIEREQREKHLAPTDKQLKRFKPTRLPRAIPLEVLHAAYLLPLPEYTPSQEPHTFGNVKERFTNMNCEFYDMEPQNGDNNEATAMSESMRTAASERKTRTQTDDTQGSTRTLTRTQSETRTQGGNDENVGRNGNGGGFWRSLVGYVGLTCFSSEEESADDKYVKVGNGFWRSFTAGIEQMIWGYDYWTYEKLSTPGKQHLYNLSEVQKKEGNVVQLHGKKIEPKAKYVQLQPDSEYCVKVKGHLKKCWKKAYKGQEEEMNYFSDLWDACVDQKRARAGGNSAKKKKKDPHRPSEELRKKYILEPFTENNEIDFFKLLRTMLAEKFVDIGHDGWRHKHRPNAPIHPFTTEEVRATLLTAREMFDKCPAILELTGDCITFGDIHGSYESLVHLLFRNGGFLTKPIIILGDIVDRGPRSIDCLLLVCVLKICYPHLVHVIRGNHECANTNSKYGLLEECSGAFSDDAKSLYGDMNLMMNKLSLCAIKNKDTFLCHGGWSTLFTSRDELDRLVQKYESTRPKKKGESLTEFDLAALALMWSDPIMYYKNGNLDEPFSVPSIRGPPGVVMFNMAMHEKICRDCGFKVLIRGHQPRPGGFYHYPSRNGFHIITIFSAADSYTYGEAPRHNLAAVLEDVGNNRVEVIQFWNFKTYVENAPVADEATVYDETEIDEIYKENERRAMRRKKNEAQNESENREEPQPGNNSKTESNNNKNGKLKKAKSSKTKNKQAKGGKEKKEAKVKADAEPSKAGSKQSSVVVEGKKSRKEGGAKREDAKPSKAGSKQPSVVEEVKKSRKEGGAKKKDAKK